MKKNVISKLFEAYNTGEIMKDGKEYFKVTAVNITRHPDYVPAKIVQIEFSQTDETGEL